MSNLKLKTFKLARGQASHPVIVAAREGYTAARMGKPFNPDQYPTRQDQANYEIGRLHVVNMRAAGIDPPPWPAGANLPARVKALMSRAIDAIGHPTPAHGARQAPAP